MWQSAQHLCILMPEKCYRGLINQSSMLLLPPGTACAVLGPAVLGMLRGGPGTCWQALLPSISVALAGLGFMLSSSISIA